MENNVLAQEGGRYSLGYVHNEREMNIVSLI